MKVLLKVIMRLALSATLYSHETMSLVGMYEQKSQNSKKMDQDSFYLDFFLLFIKIKWELMGDL